MPSVNHLDDFPDRLSPMLVKELRQGMRAHGFMLLFLIFQCLLAFILLSAGASYDSENSGSVASGIIFTMFSIAVLVIQPLRGISALSSEISANTIEMMSLTRLSAWRIVFGKWVAIVSQSALILITIVPYLILRYFFGGMNLLHELVMLGLIFLTSMAFTAIMVGFSGTTVKLVRVLPVIGAFFLIQVIPGLLFGGRFMRMSIGSFSSWETFVAIVCYLGCISYLGWCALSHGTSSIAPVAENHSTPRRLVALVLAVITLLAGLHPDVAPQALTMIFAIILVPALVSALTEPAIVLPPACRPFVRFGLPGRAVAGFLLPGWPCGTFFSFLLLALAVSGIAACMFTKATPLSSNELTEFGVISLSLAGTLLFPAMLAAVFCKDETKRFGRFLVFLLLSILLLITPLILAGLNDNDGILWIFAWNPPVGIALLSWADNPTDKGTVFITMVIVDLAISAILLISAMRRMSYAREAMQAAEDAPAGLPEAAATQA